MKELLDYNELQLKLLSIYNSEHRLFLMLTYAGLCRVGEVVRSNPKYSHNPALTSDSIKLMPNHVIIEILTEKVHNYRRVPINRDIETWLTEPLAWLKEHKQGILFDYSTRWGEKVFNKYFDSQHIHLLRGWRATHLLQGKCTKERLPESVVMRMGGWTDTKSLHKAYNSTIIEDYLDLI